MAATLVVPLAAQDDLKRLAAMDDAPYQRLLQFVETLPTTGIITASPYQAMGNVPSSDRELFYTIIAVVGHILKSAARSGVPVDDVPAQVQAQVVMSTDPLAEPLRTRLNGLISQPGLGLHARAWDLMFEDERLASGFRIVTDIRPIFDETAKKQEGSVLVNRLHITYLEEGQRRSLFLAIDEDDIDRLATIVDRVKQKIATLTSGGQEK